MAKVNCHLDLWAYCGRIILFVLNDMGRSIWELERWLSDLEGTLLLQRTQAGLTALTHVCDYRSRRADTLWLLQALLLTCTQDLHIL